MAGRNITRGAADLLSADAMPAQLPLLFARAGYAIGIAEGFAVDNKIGVLRVERAASAITISVHGNKLPKVMTLFIVACTKKTAPHEAALLWKRCLGGTGASELAHKYCR